MVEDNTNSINKRNAFMGTIMVCVTYAIIALLMLGFIYLTEVGKSIFNENLKVFVSTFVIGTILIIVTMTFLVLDWKPEEKIIKAKEITGLMSCPDYWINKKQTEAEKINMKNNLKYDSSVGKFYVLDTTLIPAASTSNGFYDVYNTIDMDLFENKCSIDTNILQTPDNKTGQWNTATYNINGEFTKLDDQKKFIESMLIMSSSNIDNIKVTSTTPLKCDTVFPEYLAKLDAEDYASRDFIGKSNKYRCEFSKACGVPWTSAGCK